MQFLKPAAFLATCEPGVSASSPETSVRVNGWLSLPQRSPNGPFWAFCAGVDDAVQPATTGGAVTDYWYKAGAAATLSSKIQIGGPTIKIGIGVAEVGVTIDITDDKAAYDTYKYTFSKSYRCVVVEPTATQQ